MSYQLQLIDPKSTSASRDDRVFVLSLVDKKAPLSTTGLMDRRLFSGENRLHAIKDPQYQLWHLKYEHGTIPEPLQQKFTSFKTLLRYVQDYFLKRNIELTEVID